MKSKIGDKQRLRHILDAITEIEGYVKNTGEEDFLNNSMMRFASVKQIEIIGEAANQLSGSLKQQFAEIEWQQITGMRNVLVHEVFWNRYEIGMAGHHKRYSSPEIFN